jgi:putative FmdB family regulatory protein
MPIYPFFCKKCGHQEEIFLKMSDEKPTVCPLENCKGEYCRDYSGLNSVVDSKKIKTIGDLANKNTEDLVKEGKLPKSTLNWESKKRELKKKKQHMADIANMTPAQKHHYIMTGEKKI